MKELISILMGVFNAEDTLGKAIESIISQTYPNWELIIYDDGSTDKSYEVAVSYVDPRIAIIRSNHNRGLGYALNRCLEKATGSVIARMDADDISLPTRLFTELAYLNTHPDCDVVGTAITMFDNTGDYCTRGVDIAELQREDFIAGSPIAHPTVMMKRSALVDVGGYNETKDTLWVEDVDLWIRLLQKGCKFHVIPEVLLRYRYDYNSVKRQTMQSRINGAVLTIRGRKALGLSLKYDYYAIRTVVIGLIPTPLRYWLQMKRLKR